MGMNERLTDRPDHFLWHALAIILNGKSNLFTICCQMSRKCDQQVRATMANGIVDQVEQYLTKSPFVCKDGQRRIPDFCLDCG